MTTIVFISVMVFLIKFSTERFWLYWFLILGVSVQCGYTVGIVGVAVWMGIAKVLKDMLQAR